MKEIRRESLYAKNVHTVELEGEEVNYTDLQLINIADGSGKDDRGSHFGGSVSRYTLDGKPMAAITVFID